MSERTFRQAVDEKMMQTVMQRGEETVITDKNETLSGVDAQLYKEAKYINMLRTTPSDVALMHSDHRADSLVPGIEDGLKTKQKHRKKLRTRTIKNYDKAMEETQGYGTVQTIPLMRSMKDFYKNEKKQKKRVESDIIKLADMTIPSDIFDVIISEDHSHFDIKEAFRIREGLGRIREFKDTRPDDYAFLDVSVTAKLENLLLMKEPFEETLKVVLAANGLKEDGSVADQALIEESRRRYASTKEAFKEYADSFHEKVGASMASESSKRIKQAKERNDIETKKRAIRDDILDKDLSETESSAVIKEFKRSEFYLKIAFFMEEDRVKSREYVEKALKAWKYVQLSETQKKELTEEQKEYFDTSLSFASEGFARLLEVIPEMVHNLKGATVEQLLSMQEQIVNVSAQADYLWGLSHSVTDAENKMLFSKLGLSQTE